MQEDNSLEALVNPGDSANVFFNFEKLPPDFDPLLQNSYSRTNAMWLMELCRLVYRTDSIRPAREDFLRQQKLHELHFFNAERTQGALVTGKNFAVLVFRGTLGFDDWLSDLDGVQINWTGEGKIHEGFKRQLDLIWDGVSGELDKLTVPVFYTGHSLGAALATLAAARRFVERKPPAAALYTFGSPRVGTTGFIHAFPSNFLHCRVVNDADTVPTVPPRSFDIGTFLPGYHHVGTLHQIEHDGHLRRGKPNDDDDAVAAAFQQAVKGVTDLKAKFASFRARKMISLPEQFTDHAPINYSARIERAGDFS